jgi:hypothetical protein
MKFTVTIEHLDFKITGEIPYHDPKVKKAVDKAINYSDQKKLGIMQPDERLPYYLKQLTLFLFQNTTPGMSLFAKLDYLKLIRPDARKVMIDGPQVKIDKIEFPEIKPNQMEVNIEE